MSTAVMPSQLELSEIFPNRRNSSSNGVCRTQQSVYESELRQQWEMYCNTTTTTTTSYYVSRHRNLSGPCTGSGRATNLDNRALATPPPGVPGCRAEREGQSSRDKENQHPRGESGRRKLDRSLSDSEDRINGNGRGVNSSRYKTELCRPFDESGHCKYGDKCQFAHGAHELRNLTRHPKYKTERCRTYHTIGFCPYGPRCHFIHNEDDNNLTQRKNASNTSNVPRLSSPKYILPPGSSSVLAHRPSDLSGLKSLGSSFESVSPTSSPGNLSPSHFDDQFPAVGTFSPSAVNEAYTDTARNGESVRTSPVFNFPTPDPTSVGSVTAPLDVQTQHMYYNSNVLDMAALERFSAVLNISQNQHNNQSSYSTNLNVCQMQQQAGFVEPLSPVETRWPVGQVAAEPIVGRQPPTSSPPLSEDSMGSNGSLEKSSPTSASVDNLEFLISCPLDMGRSMRLPIFNQLSSDS